MRIEHFPWSDLGHSFDVMKWSDEYSKSDVPVAPMVRKRFSFAIITIITFRNIFSGRLWNFHRNLSGIFFVLKCCWKQIKRKKLINKFFINKILAYFFYDAQWLLLIRTVTDSDFLCHKKNIVPCQTKTLTRIDSIYWLIKKWEDGKKKKLCTAIPPSDSAKLIFLVHREPMI